MRGTPRRLGALRRVWHRCPKPGGVMPLGQASAGALLSSEPQRALLVPAPLLAESRLERAPNATVAVHKCEYPKDNRMISVLFLSFHSVSHCWKIKRMQVSCGKVFRGRNALGAGRVGVTSRRGPSPCWASGPFGHQHSSPQPVVFQRGCEGRQREAVPAGHPPGCAHPVLPHPGCHTAWLR